MSKNGEHLHQCSVVSWFRLAYPEFSKCLFSIPNGAYLNGNKLQRIKQMARLKKEGFKNGVSDLFLALPSADKSGLWIEMKDQGKTYLSLSDDQIEHLVLMKNIGYEAVWCSGNEAAIYEIQSYMSSVVKINNGDKK